MKFEIRNSKFEACLVRSLLSLCIILGGGRACAQTVGFLPPVELITPSSDQQTDAPVRPAVQEITESIHVMPASLSGCHGCNPFEDRNGPVLRGDPQLDGKLVGELSFVPGPLNGGWFASVEANVVAPHIKQEMFAFAGPFQTGTGFHLNNADLDWTLSPVFRLGYRLDQAAGEFIMSYQFLFSRGTALGADAFGNPAQVSSHLSMNVFDLEYACREFSLGPWCDMKWLMGVRIANVFFDTEAGNALGQQSVSNNYVEAGPMIGLNLSKRLEGTGLDFFCRLECAYSDRPRKKSMPAVGPRSTWHIPTWCWCQRSRRASAGGPLRTNGCISRQVIQFSTGRTWPRTAQAERYHRRIRAAT